MTPTAAEKIKADLAVRVRAGFTDQVPRLSYARRVYSDLGGGKTQEYGAAVFLGFISTAQCELAENIIVEHPEIGTLAIAPAVVFAEGAHIIDHDGSRFVSPGLVPAPTAR